MHNSHIDFVSEVESYCAWVTRYSHSLQMIEFTALSGFGKLCLIIWRYNVLPCTLTGSFEWNRVQGDVIKMSHGIVVVQFFMGLHLKNWRELSPWHFCPLHLESSEGNTTSLPKRGLHDVAVTSKLQRLSLCLLQRLRGGWIPDPCLRQHPPLLTFDWAVHTLFPDIPIPEFLFMVGPRKRVPPPWETLLDGDVKERKVWLHGFLVWNPHCHLLLATSPTFPLFHLWWQLQLKRGNTSWW
jgi:hypothetical protein